VRGPRRRQCQLVAAVPLLRGISVAAVALSTPQHAAVLLRLLISKQRVICAGREGQLLTVLIVQEQRFVVAQLGDALDARVRFVAAQQRVDFVLVIRTHVDQSLRLLRDWHCFVRILKQGARHGFVQALDAVDGGLTRARVLRQNEDRVVLISAVVAG